MKTRFLAPGLLCAFCATRVHANAHAYMQTQIELTRTQGARKLTEEDLTRIDMSSLLSKGMPLLVRSAQHMFKY